MNLQIQINKNWVRRLTKEYQFLQHILTWSDGLDFEATEKEEQRPDKYILGANPIPPEVLERNRQLNSTLNWTDDFPKDEPQSSAVFESFSCTLFGLFNVLEAVAKRKYGEDWNKSERYNAGMVKLRPPGYTLTGAFDSVRKNHGVVSEKTYPNNLEKMNLESWIANPPIKAVEEGKWWLKNYTIYMVEVPATLAGIKYGLQFSPIYCGGYAWYQKNGEYISFGNPNHAFAIKRVDGSNPIVGDSYDPFEKKLSADYKIFWPKFIVLEKKLSTTNKEPMTNVKIVKKENGEYGIYVPCDSEEALRSYSKNYALTIPTDEQGKIKWSELKEAGTVNLYE